jgi:hypothetical protein
MFSLECVDLTLVCVQEKKVIVIVRGPPPPLPVWLWNSDDIEGVGGFLLGSNCNQ